MIDVTLSGYQLLNMSITVLLLIAVIVAMVDLFRGHRSHVDLWLIMLALFGFALGDLALAWSTTYIPEGDAGNEFRRFVAFIFRGLSLGFLVMYLGSRYRRAHDDID